jgi:hypothetical protein
VRVSRDGRVYQALRALDRKISGGMSQMLAKRGGWLAVFIRFYLAASPLPPCIAIISGGFLGDADTYSRHFPCCMKFAPQIPLSASFPAQMLHSKIVTHKLNHNSQTCHIYQKLGTVTKRKKACLSARIQQG